MPILETAAESFFSVLLEVAYWCSIRPQGAFAVAAMTLAIAFCVRSGSPGSWEAGIALTMAATAVGFGIGRQLNHSFRENRPARIVACVIAACVTCGSLAWLISGA